MKKNMLIIGSHVKNLKKKEERQLSNKFDR